MLLRTFIAVEAPGEIVAQAAKLIGRLREAEADVKWVEPENMHFTLKFLGGVRDRDLGELCLALARATPDPFTELARVPALDGKTWNHPVIVGDRLYLRNSQEAACYQLALAPAAVH